MDSTIPKGQNMAVSFNFIVEITITLLYVKGARLNNYDKFFQYQQLTM